VLNGILAAIWRSRETAELRAAYDEFLERLDAGEVAAQASKPGDTMPGFLLPNAEGCQSALNSFQGTACKSFQLVSVVSAGVCVV